MAEGADPAEDLVQVVEQLASVVLPEDTLDTVFDLVADLAQSTLVGTRWVSITLNDGARMQTRYANAEEVRALDNVQYEHQAGPCVATVQSGRPHNVDLKQMQSSWPAFGSAARDRDIGRVLSLPLQVRGQTIGALNLYGRGTDGLASDDVEARARLFADHASIVLANAVAYADVEGRARRLLDALESRDLIGQAEGILMARQSCGADEAFDILRRASQSANRKLRDVAREMVEATQHRARPQ